MSVFAAIRNALNTRLSTLPSAPSIQWPNAENKPNLGNVYLRPTILPIRSRQMQLDGLNRYAGIYQVDVFVKASSGTKIIDQWCDALLDHFQLQVLVVGSTRVHIENVSVGTTDREEAWARGFVEIAYECYA